MSLYFIRHGESLSNERNLFAGRVDTPLTDLGRRQASQAAELLKVKGLDFDEIHTSPLSRALDTAQIIAETLHSSRPKFFVTESLLERDFGRLSEQNKSLIKKAFGASIYTSMFHSAFGLPPGGESFQQMYERVRDYYEQVLLPASNRGQRILVVAHKYIVEMFALIVARAKPETYFDFRIPNSKPLDERQLAACVRYASPKMNHLAETIESKLPAFMMLAVLAGCLVKIILGYQLSPSVFISLSILLLAVNSWFAMLRVDTKTLKESPAVWKLIAKSYGPRLVLGVALLLGSSHLILLMLGSFLLLPPAMTAPTLSFMWGGDYFTCMKATLFMSVLSPVAILASRAGSSDLPSLSPFFLIVIIGVAVPALAAQLTRARNPIRAGAQATNWGWVGAAAMIPVAALTGYQVTPSLSGLLRVDGPRDLLFAVAFFMVIRFLFWFGAKATPGLAKEKQDIAIAHSVPNVFFWLPLLPIAAAGSPIKLIAIIVFFASVWFEEKRVVRIFAKKQKTAKSGRRMSREFQQQTAYD